MAHVEQKAFFNRLQQRFPTYFRNQRVLEVGSLNINGSVRDLFIDCDFIGIDLGIGPGVDIVASGKDFNSNIPFSVTVSTECFEHNPDWVETFDNMMRLTTRPGLVIITVASTGRPEHGTSRSDSAASPFTSTSDYYLNLTTKDFINRWDFENLFSQYSFEYCNIPGDLYFYGLMK